MNRIKQINLKNLLKQIQKESTSMRRRFVVYILSATTLVIALILLLLNLFGIVNPANTYILDILDTQLQTYADHMEHDYDQIAAYAISFADQMESGIHSYLTDNNISFDELKNNPDELFSLQSDLYDTVYLNMQLAPCSGVFYILDTTVNSQSPLPLYNGIYLKYANLYSESTLNNSITLYRGAYATGKENNLTFHSGWQNEMKTNSFDSCDTIFSDETHYVLSQTVEIPDTWERARYVYVPIRDIRDHIIGVCGFEVNDLYFQLLEKSSENRFGEFIGALLDEQQGFCSGQFDSNRYGTDKVEVSHKAEYIVFDFGTEKCVGRTKNINLGNDTFSVALMMSEAQFNDYIIRGQLKTAAIIMFVLLFAFTLCVFMSKKYVSPVLKRIEQIKTNDACDEQLKIREIDDLFAFLAKKDADYEGRLKELEDAIQFAEAESRRAKEEYEKALEKHELAKEEILRLSEEHKKDIVLEDYEYFACNLKTLTPTELRVYELYLEGKTAAEIASVLGIKENTLKFHNKNIYSKLGISSRKQLLRFASLKQQQDKQYESTP